MTAATNPTNPPPPGHGVRWRRRLGYLPLALLLVASIIALVLGFRADSALDRHPVPAPSAVETDPVALACRPPLDPPASEPWLAGDGSAERTWQKHAADLANDYIVGPKGWIFWNDYIEQYASQAVGRETLSVGELSRWVTYYTSIRDALTEQGIEFYIIVTPSTSSVYPEELPAWMQELRGSTIMDQFMSEASDLPVVDLRAPLISAKSPDVNLFSWSNSHWTDYGAYVGWQQIADCVNRLYPEGPGLRVPEVSGHQVIGDFNEWASYGVQSPGNDWAVPVFDEELPEVTVTDSDGTTRVVPGDTKIDLSELPVTTSTADSWTGKSALIIRDSMGGSLSPYWDMAYSSTRQIHHLYDNFSVFPDYRELVAQTQPDVVILQLAERHLINTPPAGAHY